MNQIPASWYNDPAGSGQMRYWDGAAWTTHLRAPEPVAPPAAPSFPPPVVAPQQYQETQQYAPSQQFAPSQFGAAQPAAARPDPYANPFASASTGGNPFAAAAESGNPFASYAASLTGNQFGAGVQVAQGVFGSSRGPGIGGAISLIVIGIFILIGSSFIFSAMDASTTPPAGSVSGTGRVVSLEMSEGACSPVVEFTVDGESYMAYSSVSQQPCPFAVGDAAPLSYLPSSPESSVRLDSDASSAGLIKVVVIAFGVVFLGAGVATLVSRIVQISRGTRTWRAS